MSVAVSTSESAPTADAFLKDDIRWAQLALLNRGLYQGSLDGIFGPETRRALGQFQTINGLGQTALLDAQTWETLTGNPPTGEGSSTSDHSNSMINQSVASSLGK